MLNSQDLVDRQIRAAIRESRDLGRRRIQVVKLNQPIQRGWRRFYVVADHAANRRDRPILDAILRLIGSVVVCKNPDFRRRRGRSKKLVEIEQPLRPIHGHTWDRRLLADEWFSYFRRELLLERNGHWQPYWVFRQPSLFELRTERNWLWFFEEVDPAIETRLSELESWLTARCGRQRYDWLKGRSRHWIMGETKKQQALKRLHKKEIAQAYRDFPEVDPAAFTWRGPISFRRFIFNFPRRSPTSRGTPVRPEPVRVQLLPPGPFVPNQGTALVAQCRGSRLKPGPVSVQVRPGASSSPHHPRNVNRTSEPGFSAKEIVRPRGVWGACPPRSANLSLKSLMVA